jgi:hypothetical protein
MKRERGRRGEERSRRFLARARVSRALGACGQRPGDGGSKEKEGRREER